MATCLFQELDEILSFASDFDFVSNKDFFGNFGKGP